MIYDNAGRLVNSKKVNTGVNKIDISRLSTGLYYGYLGGSNVKFIVE